MWQLSQLSQQLNTSLTFKDAPVNFNLMKFFNTNEKSKIFNHLNINNIILGFDLISLA